MPDIVGLEDTEEKLLVQMLMVSQLWCLAILHAKVCYAIELYEEVPQIGAENGQFRHNMASNV
jgi:hypothetical protein